MSLKADPMEPLHGWLPLWAAFGSPYLTPYSPTPAPDRHLSLGHAAMFSARTHVFWLLLTNGEYITKYRNLCCMTIMSELLLGRILTLIIHSRLPLLPRFPAKSGSNWSFLNSSVRNLGLPPCSKKTFWFSECA